MQMNIERFIDILEDAKELYGEEHVEVAINTIIGFGHVYGKDFKVNHISHYITICPTGSFDPVMESVLAIDLITLKILVDTKGIILDEKISPLSGLDILRDSSNPDSKIYSHFYEQSEPNNLSC